jgi:hypothetical protein
MLFASRSLSSIEKRYAQVEREALAVVWACERLRLYLIGKEFELIVDNKAIELIYNNPNSKPSARLERWGLRLLPFHFKIKHQPGVTNIADYFSRHAIQEIKNSEDEEEHYINTLVDYQLPLSVRLEPVKEATVIDPALILVKQLIDGKKVNVEDQLIKPFVGIKSELSVSSEGLILKGTQIVIPKELQKHVIQIGHESHQEFEKTRQLLSRFVWFPGMYADIERLVKSCHVCQANSERRHYEPLKMSKMPQGSWLELAADFHGPMPCGNKLLVVIDEYSRFPIVKILKSTTAEKSDTYHPIHG